MKTFAAPLFAFFALALFWQAPPVAAQTIGTLAGSGTAGFAGDAGAPTGARINLPVAVAGDTSGNIYIADTGNHRIRRVNAARDSITTYAGTGTAGFSGDGGTATSARLNAPSGLCATPSGDLYIADTDNHRIRKISATTRLISTVAGDGNPGYRDTSVADSARFKFPSSVFVDTSGNIYIADTGNHRIRKIDTDGRVTTLAGTGTAGFSGDGGAASAAQLDGPSAVFVDSTGHIYIADTNNHRIRKISAVDSTITTVVGSGRSGFAGEGIAATAARLAFPSAVAVAGDSTIFLTDRFNHRVRRVNPGGDIITLAGNGTLGYSGDGGASNRSILASPSGLFLDHGSALYVADTGNHRIRRISLTPAVALSDTGLTSGGTAGPSSEVRLLGVPLTGDGSTSVQSLTFTLDDLVDSLATGVQTADFARLRFYESTNDTLDGDDLLIGTLDSTRIAFGEPTTITADIPPKPDADARRYYLLSAVISRYAVQGHAFKLGFVTGGLSTSKGGWGIGVAADDSLRMTIDAVATRLVFTTQPGRALSGNPILTQPVVSALDDSGFVDFDYTRTVTLSATGPGTLLHNAAVADSGIAAFSNVTYNAVSDEEDFALSATDSGSILPSVTSDSIRASTVNDPPSVDFPPLVLNEDDTLGYRAAITEIVSDPDDDRFEVTFSSKHIIARVIGDSVWVTPEPDWFGLDTLTVTAFDPFGLSGSDQATIQIRAVNDPPVLDFPDRLTFSEDDTLTLDLASRVHDPDHLFSELIWTFTPPAGLSARYTSSTGQLRLWAPPDSSGGFDLVVQVRDPLFRSDLDTVRVDILPVNDAPQLAVRDTTILQGDSLRYDLRALTTDVDHSPDQIAWTLSSASGASITLSPAGLAVVRPPPAFSGTDTLFFTATDGGGLATAAAALVTVLRVNQAPRLRALPDTLLATGQTLVWNLRDYASDPDDSVDNLIWSVSGALRVRAAMAGPVLTVTVPQGQAAYTETLRVRIFDLFGLSASANIRLKVEPVLPPIAGLPDVTFDAGKQFELPLENYLSPTAVNVAIKADSTLQAGLNPDTDIVTIAAVDSWKGTAAVVFTASDLRGRTASDTISVRVTNPAPVLTGFPQLFLDAGLSTEFPLDDYARDDEPLANLTWSALPDPGLRVGINAALHAATITADSTASGPLQVLFTATDAQQAFTSDTLHLVIHPVQIDTSTTDTTGTDTATVNRAPTISPLPDLSFHRDTFPSIELDRYAEDDGPLSALIWSATVQPEALLRVEISSARIATVTALQDSGQAKILFLATDSRGETAEGTVQVTVLPPLAEPEEGDFDRDGKITLDDFFSFVDALGLTTLHPNWNPAYDLNKNGKISFDDFFLFIDRFQKANTEAAP